jgi:hypothetical protein
MSGKPLSEFKSSAASAASAAAAMTSRSDFSESELLEGEVSASRSKSTESIPGKIRVADWAKKEILKLEDDFPEKQKKVKESLESLVDGTIDREHNIKSINNILNAREYVSKLLKLHDAYSLEKHDKDIRIFFNQVDFHDEFLFIEGASLTRDNYEIIFRFLSVFQKFILNDSISFRVSRDSKSDKEAKMFEAPIIILSRILEVLSVNNDISFLAKNFDAIIACISDTIICKNLSKQQITPNKYISIDETEESSIFPKAIDVANNLLAHQYYKFFASLKFTITFDLISKKKFDSFDNFKSKYDLVTDSSEEFLSNIFLGSIGFARNLEYANFLETNAKVNKTVEVLLKTCDSDILKSYIKHSKPNLNVTTSTRLFLEPPKNKLSIFSKDKDITLKLLKAYSSTNPLFATIYSGTKLIGTDKHTNLFKMLGILNKYGADINYKSFDDITALHIAVGFNLLPVVQLLVRLGADINAVTKDKNITPLHLSILNENLEMTNLLIENGANVNLFAEGYTPAMQCLLNDSYDQFNIMLASGKVDIDLEETAGDKKTGMSLSNCILYSCKADIAIQLGDKFQINDFPKYISNLCMRTEIPVNVYETINGVTKSFISDLDKYTASLEDKLKILDALSSSKSKLGLSPIIQVVSLKINYITRLGPESKIYSKKYLMDLNREYYISMAKIILEDKEQTHDAKMVSISTNMLRISDELSSKESQITFLKEDFILYAKAFTSYKIDEKSEAFHKNSLGLLKTMLTELKEYEELYSPELRLVYALYKSQSDIPFNTIKNLYATVLKYSKEKLFAAKSIEQNKKILSVLNDIPEDLRTTDDIDLIKRIESVQTLENINSELDVIFDSISRLLNTKNNSGSKKSKQSTKSKDASHESEDTSYKSEVAKYLDRLNKLLHAANNLNTPESFDYVEHKFTSNLMKIYNKLSNHKLADAISGNFAILVNKIQDTEYTITTKYQSPAHEIDISEEGFKEFIILYSKNKDHPQKEHPRKDHPQIAEILSRLGHIPNLDRKYADKMQTSLTNSIGCEIKELSLVKKALNLKIPPEIILSFVNALSNFIPKYSSYLDRVVKDNDKTTIHTYETKEFKDSVKENDSVSKSIIPEDLEDLESEYDNKEFEEEDDIPSPTSQDKGSTSPDTYSHDSNFLDNEDFDDSSITELANNHVVKLLEILTDAKRVFLKTKHIKYIADHIDNLKFEDTDSGFKLTHLETGKIVGTHREHGKKDYLDLAFINDLLKFFEEVGILEKYLPEEVLEEISQEETDIEFVFGGNLSSEDIIERYLAQTEDSSLSSNPAAMACSSTSLKYHELDPLGPSVKPLGEAAEAATEIDE